jgi:hypothetical protein
MLYVYIHIYTCCVVIWPHFMCVDMWCFFLLLSVFFCSRGGWEVVFGISDKGCRHIWHVLFYAIWFENLNFGGKINLKMVDPIIIFLKQSCVAFSLFRTRKISISADQSLNLFTHRFISWYGNNNNNINNMKNTQTVSHTRLFSTVLAMFSSSSSFVGADKGNRVLLNMW